MIKPKWRMPKTLLIGLLFACIGITTEVVFTSFSSVAVAFFENTPVSWALPGKSYVWMFVIYASIPLFFKLFNPIVSGKPFWFKVALAVIVIYLVEFFSGLVLKLVLGACPWEYTEGIHLMGLVRLDYLPAWSVFATLIILVYQLLDRRISE